MPSDVTNIINSTCSVCGVEVRGEKVVWKDWAEDRLDKNQREALGALQGGHVCGKCGTILCKKEHKKDVKGVTFLHGYWSSPCPSCEEPLLDGFILFEPPEGTVFPENIEGSASLSDHQDELPDEPSNAVEWKRKPVEDGEAAFNCPGCDHQHTLSIGNFKNPLVDGVAGFTSKNDFVRDTGLANVAALLVGIVVFILVYRAIFGAELLVNVGLIIPAVVAVVSHTVARLIFGIVPLFQGSKMSIYGFTCSKCKKEIVFASDGSQFALQSRMENG